ncbi:hypothetical protein BU14_0524s0008 [Porphyra umbilicalis]|uniref:Uncharacterized protein n=1 Tax=Porphyra umbilicalis TaxID=2786 RepID=A0A1X6NSD4_PORUM|nr:hypothetical protein BU14_0524s0008 [Porphyra umbilicalis]|eukprot:OSX71524.1 hypothetical protein BU14_0524s0008 [Porphyra umbilicalis]
MPLCWPVVDGPLASRSRAARPPSSGAGARRPTETPWRPVARRARRARRDPPRQVRARGRARRAPLTAHRVGVPRTRATRVRRSWRPHPLTADRHCERRPPTSRAPAPPAPSIPWVGRCGCGHRQGATYRFGSRCSPRAPLYVYARARCSRLLLPQRPRTRTLVARGAGSGGHPSTTDAAVTCPRDCHAPARPGLWRRVPSCMP